MRTLSLNFSYCLHEIALENILSAQIDIILCNLRLYCEQCSKAKVSERSSSYSSKTIELYIELIIDSRLYLL